MGLAEKWRTALLASASCTHRPTSPAPAVVSYHTDQHHCKQCLVSIAPGQRYCQSCHQTAHPDLQAWPVRQQLVARRRHRRSSSIGTLSEARELAVPFKASRAGPPEEWRHYLKDADLESYPHVFLQVANECTGSQLADCEMPPSDYTIKKADLELTYELLRPIAFGDSGGVVYKSRRLATGELYAIKVVKLTSSRQRLLMLREAYILGTAVHENVVGLIEAFEHHK